MWLLSAAMPANSTIPPHQHVAGQLVYASTGLLEVISAKGRYLVPPQQAVWLPPNLEHSITSFVESQLDTVFIDRSEMSSLPGDVCVIDVSNLLRALIIEASSLPDDYEWCGAAGRLFRTLRDQVTQAHRVPLYLPMPVDARLRALCERLQLDPADGRSLEAWGREVGASSRTLSRIFKRETGLKFSEWRRQLRIQIALQRLAKGESVTNVALAVGYESTSAFIAIFQSHLGMTPGQLRG